MQKNNDEIIIKEIKQNYDAIDKIKRLIPIGILTMIAFSFVYPLIPTRRSRESLADWIGYHYAVIFCLMLMGLVYWYGYNTAVNRRLKNINSLKSKLVSNNEEQTN